MKIKFKSMQTQVREGGRDSIFGLDDSLIPYTHYVYNGDYTLCGQATHEYLINRLGDKTKITCSKCREIIIEVKKIKVF